MPTARHLMETAIVQSLNAYHKPREGSGYEWQVDIAGQTIRIRLHSPMRLLEVGEESALAYEIRYDDDPCPSRHLPSDFLRNASFLFRPPPCKRVARCLN